VFDTLIESRRSVRSFQSKPVEAEKVDKLVEASLRAPASMSRTPWEFVVVTEPELLDRLSKAKPHGSAFLKGAPLGIVVCASPEISDVWVEDASIASLYLLLAAEDLGLGGCWIQIRNRSHSEERSAQEYISETLSLPDGLQVEAIIAVGYAHGKSPPHQRSELRFDKVHLNAFGTPYEGA
jgi:nitroreductase